MEVMSCRSVLVVVGIDCSRYSWIRSRQFRLGVLEVLCNVI